MNDQPSALSQYDHLIAGYLSGDLSASEQALLNHALIAEPALALRLADHLLLHAGMQQRIGLATAAVSAPQRVAQHAWPWWTVPVAVAALVLSALWLRPESPSLPQQEANSGERYTMAVVSEDGRERRRDIRIAVSIPTPVASGAMPGKASDTAPTARPVAVAWQRPRPVDPAESAGDDIMIAFVPVHYRPSP